MRGRTAHSQQRSAQTKRNVLLGVTGYSCSLCRRYSPFGGTGGMEQGRSLLPGWTTAMQRGGHMHGGFSWSPFKHTINGESTTLGKRARGGGGRAGGGGTTGWVATDAGTRSVVNSGADVLELKAPVIRSMGMERGLVKCVFSVLIGGGDKKEHPFLLPPPTQTKVKSCLLSEQLPNTQSRISSDLNVYSHTCLFMIVEPLVAVSGNSNMWAIIASLSISI